MKKHLFNDIYNESLFNSQLRKFMYRKGNHWAKRIEKVFDIISKLDLLGNKVLDLGSSVGAFAYEFAKIAGFRNFLAHDYEKVDAAFICKEIILNLDDIEVFIEQVKKSL